MKFFKLFSSVKIVLGYNRAIIFDIDGDFVSYIPKDMFKLLNENRGFNVSELLKKDISLENKEIIKEYLSFMIFNNLGFYTNSLKEFNSFINNHETIKLPFDLSHILIDLDDYDYFNSEIVAQIIENKISFIQIRFCRKTNIDKFQSIIKLCQLFDDSFLEELSFVIEFDENIYKYLQSEVNLINKYLSVIFHSCNGDYENYNNKNVSISFIDYIVKIPFSCGLIKKDSFVYNERFYLESQNKNTCLNRKISIDKEGKIKNCPSMINDYGDIIDTKLKDVLNDPIFRRYWGINKDQVNVCRDCEFRHICTDCRAYIESPSDIYSKPLKCGYNPYNNLWENWSDNPLKKGVQEYYKID